MNGNNGEFGCQRIAVCQNTEDERRVVTYFGSVVTLVKQSYEPTCLCSMLLCHDVTSRHGVTLRRNGVRKNTK